MSSTPVLTGKQLIKALKKMGFEVVHSKGSHHFLNTLMEDARWCLFIRVRQ